MILIVTASAHAAREVRNQLQDKQGVWVTYPGDCLAGFRFDMILVSDYYHRSLYFESTEDAIRTEQWYRENVVRRLDVGGTIINL